MKRRILILVLSVVTSCAAACSAKPERSTLEQFFNASRNLDKAALAQVATVLFDPQTSGVVERFDVVTVKDDPGDKKVVTVSAAVKLPGEKELTDKTIVLTLAKSAQRNDPAAGSRWIVTGFIERLGTPMIPRS